MTQYKKTFTRSLAFLGSFLLPLAAFAQIQNPLGSLTSIPAFVSSILADVVQVGGVIAIFAFIYSGYKFVAARGNESELGKAKQIFVNTCIGVAVLLGAQLIASIIVGTIKNLNS